MELTISPADLNAASDALDRCRQRLADAGSTFANRARGDLGDIGTNAAEATERAVHQAEHAVDVVTADIDRIARALAALAQHYPQVDRTAVAHR
jgi:hypothetical protein